MSSLLPPDRPRHPRLSSAEKGVRPTLSVGFVLLQNFTLTPFSGFIDALRLAADEGDLSRPIGCSWSVVGSSRRPVRASCGVEISPSEVYGDPRRFDYIVVVGGLLHRGPQADDSTIAFLRRAAEAGVTLVGLCTATITLLRAGVMKGHRCCVSWFHYRDLVEEFPDVTPIADQLFVVDRQRITCAGGAGAFDVAAWIIERHLGRAVAQKCLHILVVDRARPPTTAQPHPPSMRAVRDERVRRAMLLIEQNLANPLAVTEIAERLGITARHLERLFHGELRISPAQYGRQTRLNYGRFLLMQSDRSIRDIALECGFSDSSHFTREFRVAFGYLPSRARSQAGELQESR